jgi:hypothetical protein
MKTIAVKGASEELRSRLEASAERNHRSLNQEALARLEMSFAVEDATRNKTHQAWVDEALAGDFNPGSAARLRQIAARARAVVQ